MHDQIRQDLSQAIDDMSEAQKLELMEGLAHSLRVPKNGEEQELSPSQKEHLLESVRRISALPMEGPDRYGEPEAQAVQRQRESFRRLQGTLAAIPRGKDPYTNLGYSNEAHDKILYDLEQK